jgi:hypothetical protein
MVNSQKVEDYNYTQLFFFKKRIVKSIIFLNSQKQVQVNPTPLQKDRVCTKDQLNCSLNYKIVTLQSNNFNFFILSKFF